jgi:hypothetical protein
MNQRISRRLFKQLDVLIAEREDKGQRFDQSDKLAPGSAGHGRCQEP